MSRRPGPATMALYRALWRLYPRAFRERFEAAASEVFAARYEEERSRGSLRLAAFAVRTVVNVTFHGTLERLSTARVAVADAGEGLRRARRGARHHVAAVLCIALGLSVTSAILTLVSSTLLRPLPFPDADRLVRVWSVEENVELGGRGHLSYRDVLDLNASITTLDRLAVSGRARVMFLDDDGARRVEGEAIGPGYLELLDVEPFLGRSFAPDDYSPGSPATMLLSFLTWTRDYGADPAILGRTVRTDRGDFTVIGVLPQDFIGTIEADIPDLEFWIPLEHFVSEGMRADRSTEFIWTVGRLARGVTLAQAHDDVGRIGERLMDEGVLDRASGFWAEAFGENWRADLRWRNYLLLAAAGLLLLVAATNVAGLLVARAMAMQREIAVRAALGAGRDRLLRQMLSETLAITAVGGALGVALSPWLLRSFLSIAPEELPGYLSLTPDARSLGLSGGLMILTALVAGLTPAYLGSRVSPNVTLRSGGRSATRGHGSIRTSRWLVIGQVALTTVLVSSATLLVESYRAMGGADTGFRSEGVLKLAVFVDQQDVPETAGLPVFYEELRTALTELPGVAEVGLASPTVPPAFSGEARARFDGMPEELREAGVLAYLHAIDPGFMPVLDIPIVAGRGIESYDNAAVRSVAVVSETMAELMGGSDAALGRSLELDGWPVEVVGVAGDVMYLGTALPRPRDTDVYLSLAQSPSRVVSMAVIGPGDDPAALVAPIRARIARLTPRSPLDWIATVSNDLTRGFEGPRFYTVLLIAFAGSALLLTGAGVFAVLAHKVAGERVEMGIRRAFGARRGHLLATVVRSGITLCGIGLGLGLAGAIAVSGVLGRTLPGISAIDPVGPVAAAVVILLAGLFASLLPAWRATRISPSHAMRES